MTPEENRFSIAQAARALLYLHEELGVTDETFDRLSQNLRNMACARDSQVTPGRAQ
jgi:hypothetical protein